MKRDCLRKIQFGSGMWKIKGWENYDLDMDISRPLPIEDETVQYILAEHVLEHITPHQGYKFLEECYRILSPNGVARIAVPGLERHFNAPQEHLDQMKKYRWIFEPTGEQAVWSCVFNFGHQSWYTEEILAILMRSVGFSSEVCQPNESRHEGLRNIDGHFLTVGVAFNKMESVIVEGTKHD